MQKLESIAELAKLTDSNKDKSLLVYKHSYTCGICAAAYEVVQEFAASHPNITIVMIDVLANRDVSNRVADVLHIKHESPQAIAFINGSVVGHLNHWSIKTKALSNLFAPQP
ncbi:MAG: bacillithiol system redox-active protein YtxJ [Chlamydiales bacterium]|nr:bacillithiol system redox-active protein YtxJ [Chlamydiales bacterium]